MIWKVHDGGTGASTAAGARINLGLGPDSDVTFHDLTLSGDLTVAGTITGGAVSFSSIIVPDNGLSITGSSDATKILKFEVDGFTTATTRTITVPNVSDTMVTLAATQTLTNKSIVATQLTGTIASARLTGSYTGITGTGALNAGSITSGFGDIDIGGNTFTGGGVISGTGTFSGRVTAPDALFTASSDLLISGSADTSKHNIRMSSNLIISPANGGDLYLNFDSGTGITRFGDGAVGTFGSISSGGISFSGLAASFASLTLSSALSIANGGTGQNNAASARTALGVAIGSDVQAWDADLDAIAASSGTGIHARTGTATWALRTITSTDLSVTNGNGVSGNPVLDVGTSLTADKAYRRGNILAAVTESGGTPTGGLIQRISNANGEATRFADGTLICWINTFATSAAGTVGWSFPSAFSVAPAVTAVANVTALAVRIANVGSVTTTGAQVQVLDATPARIASSVHLIATGRWF